MSNLKVTQIYVTLKLLNKRFLKYCSGGQYSVHKKVRIKNRLAVLVYWFGFDLSKVNRSKSAGYFLLFVSYQVLHYSFSVDVQPCGLICGINIETQGQLALHNY